MSKVIVLDPGHGGNDSGALNGSRYEKNDNLRMAKAVKALLQKQGHTVLMTREDDSNPSYEARIGTAIKAKADLFLSIHRNSFTNTTAKGIEIYARYSPHLAAMATILEELAKEPNQANRGAKLGAYKVLYGATMPAGLIEIGFISNAEDNRLYDLHFDKYAEAIARGICYALGEEYRTQTGARYKVQVGAFNSKENAEAFLKTVQNMGLAAFLVDAKLRLTE
jgi:N-acetylmuramoyl-L-alanine amidase